MQWLWDHSGRRYLDMFAGIVTCGVGHCHPKVNEALKAQVDTLWHTTNLYLHPNIHEYAEKLTATLPGDLKVCFFVNSGSEANDLAMMMARVYTGAFDIYSLRNAYHGASPYTIGLTAHGTWKHNYANGFGIHNVMNPDPYRGIWGGSNCRDSVVQTDRKCDCAVGECMAGDKYIGQFEEQLKHTSGKKIAGFWAEGIQGVGGAVQFPKNFLKGAYELVRERGGLCIADEVQTGFGRLGTDMWGFQHHGVMPDMVIMAKSIANGFPMGALVTTPKIAQAIVGTNHLNTYAGNPLATKVASTVLDVIEEESLQNKCLTLGNYLLTNLAKFRDEFEFVGDVRGKGLMIGIEMVEDKVSRKPLNGATFEAIWNRIKDLGVIVGRGGLHGNTFRMKPPMCITKDDIDFTLAVMKQAMTEVRDQN